jgi:hypothetical protein
MNMIRDARSAASSLARSRALRRRTRSPRHTITTPEGLAGFRAKHAHRVFRSASGKAASRPPAALMARISA